MAENNPRMKKLPPEVVGRAITDPTFRKKLLKNPRGTLKDDYPALAADEELMKALESANKDLAELLVEALGKNTYSPGSYWI